MLILPCKYEMIELLAFGPQGEWLLAAEDSELVNPLFHWFDLAVGKELSLEYLPYWGQRIAVAGERGLVAVGSEDGVHLQLVRRDSLQPVGIFPRVPAARLPAAVALTPQGDRLAVADYI